MYRFIESICCQDGEIQNLDLHQERVNRTLRKFHLGSSIKIAKCLKDLPNTGKHKCRIVYGQQVESCEISEYPNRSITSLKLIIDDAIDYEFKSEDRQNLSRLFEQRGNCDDIIIVKNGLCTDSYFANLAFYNGSKWITPSEPLLKGVRREQLIRGGSITEENVSVEYIDQFEKVSLINAMLDLGEVEIHIKNIN
ncbi:MAG: aminotransferase class IV [Cyclobacteriaceae bacterium]